LATNRKAVSEKLYIPLQLMRVLYDWQSFQMNLNKHFTAIEFFLVPLYLSSFDILCQIYDSNLWATEELPVSVRSMHLCWTDCLTIFARSLYLKPTTLIVINAW